MDQDYYLPYVIYTNIGKLLQTSKLELISSDATGISKEQHKKKSSSKSQERKKEETQKQEPREELLDKETFTQAFQYYSYIMIEAADSKNKDRRYPQYISPSTKSLPVKTIFIITDINSDYVKSSQGVVKLFNSIPRINESEKKYNMDIIIISYNSLTSHITNKFNDYNNKGSDSSGYIRIISYEYSMFISEKLRHKSSPEYKILSRTEEKEVLEEFYSDKINFPKMRVSDPAAVWLGAEVTNIIEAKILSENTGIDIKYLVVRP